MGKEINVAYGYGDADNKNTKTNFQWELEKV